MLKIAPAYEDEDVAGLIIQPNYRALKILRRGLVGHCAVCFCFAKGGRVFGISLMIVIGMLFNLVEICAERILGNFLKVDIDCCVNPKTFVHRAIPSHRGNYLLTDVINRVGLPLSVLPAPNHDFFPSRLGALFAADEVKIAHPVERVIARFA